MPEILHCDIFTCWAHQLLSLKVFDEMYSISLFLELIILLHSYYWIPRVLDISWIEIFCKEHILWVFVYISYFALQSDFWWLLILFLNLMAVAGNITKWTCQLSEGPGHAPTLLSNKSLEVAHVPGDLTYLVFQPANSSALRGHLTSPARPHGSHLAISLTVLPRSSHFHKMPHAPLVSHLNT